MRRFTSSRTCQTYQDLTRLRTDGPMPLQKPIPRQPGGRYPDVAASMKAIRSARNWAADLGSVYTMCPDS